MPRVLPALWVALWRLRCHNPGRLVTNRVVPTPFLRCALRTRVSNSFWCVLQFATMRREPALRTCILNAALCGVRCGATNIYISLSLYIYIYIHTHITYIHITAILAQGLSREPITTSSIVVLSHETATMLCTGRPVIRSKQRDPNPKDNSFVRKDTSTCKGFHSTFAAFFSY